MSEWRSRASKLSSNHYQYHIDKLISLEIQQSIMLSCYYNVTNLGSDDQNLGAVD